MQPNHKLKNAKPLLDTSALIALLKKENGYKKVEEVLGHSAISSVNLAELVAILAKNSIPENEIDDIIRDMVPEIISFDEDLGIQTGKLHGFTFKYGLSLGDRACIATAKHYNMDVYTADKVWDELHIPGVKIHLIR